jgi:hypothetical protein
MTHDAPAVRCAAMKRSVHSSAVVVLLFAFLAGGPLASSCFAQAVDPVQAAKDAFNKAKAQLQGHTAATQPASQQATSGSQPAPGAQPPGTQPAGTRLAVNSALSSSLLTPAPAGGLAPAVLPDLLGVHVGEPPEQAIAELQKLYPVVRGPGGAVLSAISSTPANHYPFSNAPLYFSAVYNTRLNAAPGCSTNSCQGEDRIDAIFSGPPEKMLVQLRRSLSWAIGKEPTSVTLKNALIEKYGQNFVEGPGLTLTWLFDETGKPMPPLAKAVAFTGCQGIISNQAGVGGGLPSYLGIPQQPQQPVPQQDLDRIVKVRCGMQVQVVASINGTAGGTANALGVVISEIAADLRAAFAAENYIRQERSAHSNQQLKNAEQQAAPSF